MPHIQAVLFDYGLVLSGPPDPAAWSQMRHISGLSEDLLHREYWAHRNSYDSGHLNAHAYWSSVAAGAGILLTPTQIERLIAADVDFWSTLNAPMLEWVARLQQARIRTGILSNMPDAMEAGLRARHAWIEAFNHHTWSHAVRLAKPDPAIYDHAAEGLNTAPANILFIDDRADNIAAAQACGMEAVQYLDHAGFEREMHARGLSHLLSLADSSSFQKGKL